MNPHQRAWKRLACFVVIAVGWVTASVFAGTRTWDGKHDTSAIAVRVAYFVPADRKPLADWRERVDYFCRRIRLFHHREFTGQSVLTTHVHPEPFVSKLTTEELRAGDANAIFYRTLRETESRLKDAPLPEKAFPILLVLSEINWRPLDDFYRLRPQDGQLVFEGNYNRGQHFPGATAGGARATYFAKEGKGWGLVSADGWRVPYRGSDCVVYHEGCGHTVGLPHPEPGNGSVMSQGQYRGWLSESWLDKEQKLKLRWEPTDAPSDSQTKLFTEFTATPQPRVPKPGEPVHLTLTWPDDVEVKRVRMRYQTSVTGPWVEVPQSWSKAEPELASIGTFDRPTPVSYRIDAELVDGTRAELWGYFQVRSDPKQLPLPARPSSDLLASADPEAGKSNRDGSPVKEIDLLKLIDPTSCWQNGMWSLAEGRLLGPKQFGARLQLPYVPPEEYRLTVIVEPLDPPNGLILGQRSGKQRFVALFNYMANGKTLSALENIDGQNVGNATTRTGSVFRKNQLSQVIVTVTRKGVLVNVDGRKIIEWKGDADRLSLSDYWKTPDERALFIGAYDCRYRFHRITLEPLSGEGTVTND
ncbi:hypothetical protein [Thalassoroseus pseudoceratinae]|uniref:hypothetical protein n=1 Tax=Thalassoroseus pseudoceratinae TaxID=2713176 RepID=UPI0014214AA7|nr:hypothetical protein [Thalassoroseus pseudoceratinae]